MNFLKKLENEIKHHENTDKNDIPSKNRINVLKSILKVKRENNNDSMACKKMLYLLLVKICISLIELQHEELISLDLADLDLIATKLGNPGTPIDDLFELTEYLLKEKYQDIYPIMKLRDELIGLIYERLILEKSY